MLISRMFSYVNSIHESLVFKLVNRFLKFFSELVDCVFFQIRSLSVFFNFLILVHLLVYILNKKYNNYNSWQPNVILPENSLTATILANQIDIMGVQIH